MKYELSLSVETDKETGDIMAVYFQVRTGKVSKVIEREKGAVFVNYAKNGELLGVEMLAPCNISVLDKIAAKEPMTTRSTTRRFFRRAVPRQMAGTVS